MCSSIQFSSISSCSGVKPTAPRTPKPPALLTATTTSRQWVKAKIGNSMPSSSQRAVRMVSPRDVARTRSTRCADRVQGGDDGRVVALVEREAATAVLRDAVARGVAHVLVSGEAGAGKTSLVRALVADLPPSDYAIGACDSLRTARPLAPFLDWGDDPERVLAT